MSYCFGGGGRGQSENELLKGALPGQFPFSCHTYLVSSISMVRNECSKTFLILNCTIHS